MNEIIDYLKIGQSNELSGRDRKLYRILEIIPGFLSWFTLLFLLIMSYFYPVQVAYFIIAFDVYWLLLVLFLGIHLVVSYFRMKKGQKTDWIEKLAKFKERELITKTRDGEVLGKEIIRWEDITHLMIFPFSYEGIDVIRPSIEAIARSGYPQDKIILVMAAEGRAGKAAIERAQIIKNEFGDKFNEVVVTVHPDGIEGEIKGKGANQAWAAKVIKKDFIDNKRLDPNKVLVSVFDMDTIIGPQYFHCLTYNFLSSREPYRESYQPIPVYHNNVWGAPFFARVAASSNTFWQMMQQIRSEKLATYSSHSMTWRALEDIGFWSTTMVSEDSRIFWHCFCYYRGNYRVKPLYYPVSMDVTADAGLKETAKSLYKQQRRWGWGVENVPYLVFNTIKLWKIIPRGKFINRILVQLYGFHSWATNALIIAVIGWMPMLLGGDRFNATVLSANLPVVTRTLMTIAMLGLVLSAIVSTILLPKKPKKYGFGKYPAMLLQWLILPFTIVIFGSIPGLEAQTRLMINKRLGFQVTPKGKLEEGGKAVGANWDQA